jgi:serine/threonine-protein kinase
MADAVVAPKASGAAQIGAYDILFELGHGGMGAVYLGRAVGAAAGVGGFERLIAIKRLHLHLTGRADSVERFLDEAKVAARIHHANVVGIHQVGSDDAGHFLVQDYVEGDTLEGLVDFATLKRQRLPPPIVLRIALDALSGLHAVHEARDAEGRPLGILHRDVSPQNLLVGRDGVTRLADFGIAKHALSSVVTDGQYLQGRVLYMPPEYLARAPIDRRFDVYGVGITMFVALTGDAPWPGASEAQIVHFATTTGVPRLSASGLAIAPAIEAVVARACERDPAARFASAREMLEAIEEIGRHTGWIASHGEVAALVEELAGRELAARRAAVARARGRDGGATTPEVAALAMGAAKSQRTGVFASVAAASALALGGAALYFALRRPPPVAPGSASTLMTAPAGDATTPAPVGATASAAATQATPDASTTSATSVAGPGPSARAAKPPSSRPLQSSTVASRAASSAAPAAPGPITTANPYR